QGKDSCSKGLKSKTTQEFQRNSLNISLTGCPLEEKISEMNQSVSEGFILGALAIAMIDNPLLPLTGHRICNECMKACIYQKQEPVNIPAIETKVLRDILSLPWGVEIYSLLTRWNPLNFERPLPKDLTNHKILVAGTGPAGINLSHHLLNEGFAVFAIDGLKIEPLSNELVGAGFKPIRDFKEIQENLDERVIGGFGGVAEYGITIRWDKNFLKLVRIILERRDHFHLKGGIRLGSNITIEQAFLYGFDHIALALGAGKPNLVPIKNNLAKGVRMASDFLMALQLTGAFQKNNLANLELRLPVIVIGGGLTAIDTATEAFAYYPRQVEKFLHIYETLKQNNIDVDQNWSIQEKEDAQIWLDHARAIKHENETAILEDRQPNIIKLLRSWGGVSIAYRKTLQESPSYTLNHEEVSKAFEEGIYFIENITPVEIELDQYQATKGLKVKHHDVDLILPAKTILIAAGTQPNITLKDETSFLKTDGKYFEAQNLASITINPEKS
ncbi:MAG: FAD-dependent oxidoreductase, partial [Alphaproteobacteria bacterium]|nr:FAD-dependent oxidoreductase [Alphaproteobacteria bacterium]